jgi:hypothetical protein
VPSEVLEREAVSLAGFIASQFDAARGNRTIRRSTKVILSWRRLTDVTQVLPIIRVLPRNPAVHYPVIQATTLCRVPSIRSAQTIPAACTCLDRQANA